MKKLHKIIPWWLVLLILLIPGPFIYIFYLSVTQLELSNTIGIFSLFYSMIAVFITMIIAYLVNKFDRGILQFENRQEYGSLIERRYYFWNKLKDSYQEFYKANKKKYKLDNEDKSIHKVIIKVGLPPGLIDPHTYNQLAENICKYKLPEKHEPVQKFLWEFSKAVFPKKPDEKLISISCIKSKKFHLARSILGDFWERTCNDYSFDYIQDEYHKEVFSMILLSWLDITHRMYTDEKNSKGKTNMYIIALKLWQQLK